MVLMVTCFLFGWAPNFCLADAFARQRVLRGSRRQLGSSTRRDYILSLAEQREQLCCARHFVDSSHALSPAGLFFATGENQTQTLRSLLDLLLAWTTTVHDTHTKALDWFGQVSTNDISSPYLKTTFKPLPNWSLIEA